MLEAILALLGGKGLAAIGGLLLTGLTLLAGYFKVRGDAKREERAKVAAETLDTVAADKRARDAVDELTVEQAKAELAKWSR